MFCFKCGKEIPESEKFCHFCGADQGRTLRIIKTLKEAEAMDKVIRIKQTVTTADQIAKERIDENSASLGAEIDQAVNQAEETVKNAAQNVEHSAVQTVNDLTDGVKTAVTDAVDNIKDAFGGNETK